MKEDLMNLNKANRERSRIGGSALLALAVVLCLTAGAHAAEPTLVIEDARIIVGDGEVKEVATVVIVNDRIQQIVPTNPQHMDENVKRVDARGMTLMPGLIDTHVHFFGLTAHGQAGYEEQLNTLAPTYLHDYVRHGVTTVRSLADPLELVLELRTRVDEGRIEVGPRILLAGPCFTAPGGHPAVTLGRDDPWMREAIAFEVDDADAARAMVRHLAAQGVDAIKAVLEAGQGLGMPETLPRLSLDVLSAIVDESHRHHLPVSVHTHREQDVRDAVMAGADGVEHGVCDAAISDPRLADLLLERDVTYTPTLWILSLDQEYGLLNNAMQNLKSISDKGVRICLGTDTLSSRPAPGLNTIREMELMAQAGLTTQKIISAGTRDAAEHLGLLQDLGTVEPGKLADLLLISGDPLQDISEIRKLAMVIKDGRIVHSSQAEAAAPIARPVQTNPVNWFEIPVIDMERAKRFYEHVLNVRFQGLRFPGVEMAFFPALPGAAGATGALMKGESFQPSHRGVQVYFTTPDIDQTLQLVQQLNAKVLLPKTPIGPFGAIASFEDSEGNRIGLRSSQ